MNRVRLRLSTISLLIALVLAGCLIKPKPSADAVATEVAEAAFHILTQTAYASSPTPPPPTSTSTFNSTDTPTTEPTSSEPFRQPQTVIFASCGLGGPEPTYAHETSIKKGKGVELLGIGNIPGWFIIRDPYFHRPCWIQAADLKIFPNTDLSKYPVMTPGIPPMGQ